MLQALREQPWQPPPLQPGAKVPGEMKAHILCQPQQLRGAVRLPSSLHTDE